MKETKQDDKTVYKNIELWQILRAICIMCVVAIHSRAGISANYNKIEKGYYLIVRNLINFPVPVFFFISGYFSSISLKKYGDVHSRSSGGYFVRRIIRLGIPYLIWSFVYLLPEFVNHSVNTKTIVMKLILGKAAAPFYYIIVLTFFTLLTPFLLKAVKSRYKWIPLWISILWFLALYITQLAGINVWDYIHYTPVWLPFYYMGLYVHVWKTEVKMPVSKIILSVCIAFVFEIIENMWIYICYGNANMAYGMIRLGGFLYAGSICVLAYKKCSDYDTVQRGSSSWIESGLIQIGNISYGIFYIHYLIIMIISKVLNFVNITGLFLCRGLEICGGMVISYMVIYVVKYVIGDKWRRILLGF
ncbi:MAG: acyltransferase [Hungatella sp.]|nr:acyltransferase [Hungatella sp.]